MKSREMEKLGVPKGPVRKAAIQAVTRARAVGRSKELIAEDIRALVKNTEAWLKDPVYGDFALMLKNQQSLYSGDFFQCDESRSCGFTELVEPGAEEFSVFAGQRHEVGHGAKRDEVEVLLEVEVTLVLQPFLSPSLSSRCASRPSPGRRGSPPLVDGPW